MSDRYQVVTLHLSDGRTWKLTGQALDGYEGMAIVRAEVGEPLPLPPGCFWEIFPENETERRTQSKEPGE